MKEKLDFNHPNHLKLWLKVGYQVLKVSVKYIRKVLWKTTCVIVAEKIIVINRDNSSISFWKAYLLVCHLVQRKKANISMKQFHFNMITWNSLKCSFTTNNLRITSTRMLIIAKLINTCKAMEEAHAQKYSLYTRYKREDLAYRLLW